MQYEEFSALLNSKITHKKENGKTFKNVPQNQFLDSILTISQF